MPEKCIVAELFPDVAERKARLTDVVASAAPVPALVAVLRHVAFRPLRKCNRAHQHIAILDHAGKVFTVADQ